MFSWEGLAPKCVARILGVACGLRRAWPPPYLPLSARSRYEKTYAALPLAQK